jgi:hypothetical protein
MMRPANRNIAVPSGERDQKRTQDTQGEADIGQLHSAELVGQSAGDDNENPGKQCGDADRDVALAIGDVQVVAHGRRDVQGRLGKEPEGHDRQTIPKINRLVPS